MFRVLNQHLTVTMDTHFHGPTIYDSAGVATLARAILGRFKKYNLQPNQISQRIGDQLFNYELSFSLFNGLAQFRFGSEQLSLNIPNGRTQKDAAIILDCCVLAQECLAQGIGSKIYLQAASHATFEVAENSDAFFSPFKDPPQAIQDGGKIIFVKENDWPSSVRLAVERSLVFPAGVFMNWSTERPIISDIEKFQLMVDAFDQSAKKIGLEMRFPDEQLNSTT